MKKKLSKKWKDIQKEVKVMEGNKPKRAHAVRNALARYGEDGGKFLITPQQENEVVQLVKAWGNKNFCTCKCIKRELKLEASPRTIARALNRNGYRWCQVSRKSLRTAKQDSSSLQ